MSAWSKAKKALAKFPELVVTAVDAGGYPFSVRVASSAYDAESGALPVLVPASIEAVAGPAGVLAHKHDEKLWNMAMVTLKGRLERDGDGWRFVTTAYDPPSPWAMLGRIKRSANGYLARRGLARPVVNFAGIDELWKRVKDVHET